MDVQITPEPSPEEREAIIRALELERRSAAEPTPWQAVALGAPAADVRRVDRSVQTDARMNRASW